MDTELQLKIYRLAHENNMTIKDFVKKIERIFHVDTSKYPKTEDGAVIYPDDTIGIDMDMTTDEELKIHMAAQLQGITTNEFVIRAVTSAIGNTEEFTDADTGC